VSGQSLRHVRGVAALLLRDNIDTDVIAPSRLSVPGLGRQGYEAILFGDWRFHPDGSEREDFVLNRAPYRHAEILVTGANFGCGSSRETAVWALRGFGIKAIIAPSFGTIFQTNCYNNTIAPLTLDASEHRRFTNEIKKIEDPPHVEIDLEQCALRAGNGPWHSFSIDERGRRQLVAGIDAIDETLRFRPAIKRFREHDRQQRPWLYRQVTF
jgi:3-isopropylmalate/(R)-2-methylmalate dehydratase small subunit